MIKTGPGGALIVMASLALIATTSILVDQRQHLTPIMDSIMMRSTWISQSASLSVTTANDNVMANDTTNSHISSSTSSIHAFPNTTTTTKSSTASSWIFLQKNDQQWMQQLHPIVLEPFHLVLFWSPKVACTIWKQMARRIMGYSDWKTTLPHNLSTNGLKYLYDYPQDQANIMMNAPTWTRAMFVRDPKDRFLSAYLDKGRAVTRNSIALRTLCCVTERRRQAAGMEHHHADLACHFGTTNDTNHTTIDYGSFVAFWNVTTTCDNDHWDPQVSRYPKRYLSKLDFVGHQEQLATDSQILLKRIGAWDEFGVTGWGQGGQEAFGQSRSAVTHKTTSVMDTYDRKLSKYYTPALEALVEDKYRDDYQRSEYQLPKRKIVYDKY